MKKRKIWLKEKTKHNLSLDLGFILKFMTNQTMKHYFFIKHSIIKYLIYFQERCNIKWIPKTQGPETPVKKVKNYLNFK